ncbi:MAG: hypothetical protein ACREH4_03785 [Vitreimonas sp.]
MIQHRANLIHALEGIAIFHLAANPSALIEFMDTSEELYLRWNGAYIRRGWFTAQFSAEQREALAAFDVRSRTISAKYNKLPPILKLVASADGRDLCARAARLLELLKS